MPKESEMLSASARISKAVIIVILEFAMPLRPMIIANPVITAEVAPKLKFLSLNMMFYAASFL
jgi:hypothetical protein